MCTLEPKIKDTFSYILTLLCVLWNLRLKIPFHTFYTYLAFLCVLRRLIAITVSKTPLRVPLIELLKISIVTFMAQGVHWRLQLITIVALCFEYKSPVTLS